MLKHCSHCDLDLPKEDFYAFYLARPVAPCKACVKARVARRYDQLSAAGVCYGCRKRKVSRSHKLCPSCRENRRDYYHKNGDRNRQDSKDRKHLDKIAAFDAYGGAVCKCCGETGLDFLSIDHVNGDGAAHREEIAGHRRSTSKTFAGHQMYRWLRLHNYPPGFQVLCMNCNFAKGHFGQCPHERKLRVVA